MARIKNGITGAFSGKVGTVVGYTRYGQTYMRSIPKKITTEPSEAQLDNRKAMASVQIWLKAIKAYVRVGFQSYSEKQHGFGSALSYNKLNALRDDFTIDPARALISWGDLPEPLNAAVSNPEPGVLEFTWDPISKDTSHVLLLVYSSDKDPDGDLCGAKRSEGKHTLRCENTIGSEADIYLGFVSEDRDRCSNSVYLGKLSVE